MALGVDGIQVASRFVTTEECDADIRYKEAYIKAAKEEIAIVKSPVGMPGRAILNPFMKRVMDGEKFTPKKCLGCLHKCEPAKIPYCITERLVAAAKGEVRKRFFSAEKGVQTAGNYDGRRRDPITDGRRKETGRKIDR